MGSGLYKFYGWSINNFQIRQMPKPHSFNTEPFCSIDEGQYEILTDNYAHEKLLNIKLNQKTEKGNIKLKNQISRKDGKLKSSGEIKLWFPFWNNRTFYFKSKNNEVKLHYDHGISEINKHNVNFFGSLQIQKNFLNPVLKAGFSVIADKYDVNFRARISENSDKTLNYELQKRAKHVWGKWTLEGYKVTNLNSLDLLRNAIQIRYQQNEQNQFYFRGANERRRSIRNFDFANIDSYITEFFFNATRKINSDTRTALQVEFNKHGPVGGTFAVEKKLPQRNATVLARAQTRKAVAFSYEGLLKDYGKYLVGMEVSDLGGKNEVKYGMQFILNL